MVEVNEIDWRELDAALADVTLRSQRLKPAFRELRKPMRQDQRDHARSAEGPEGAWAARSLITEARRRATNRRVRITKAMRAIAPKKFASRSRPKALLGRLPKAIITTVGDLFIRTTSRVPWAGSQQRGGRVGRGVRLPARPFLWLSEKLLETARTTIGAYVVKGWKR